MKSYSQLRGCLSKKAWPTKVLAEKEAGILNEINAPGSPLRTVYTCSFCGWFHVGATWSATDPGKLIHG